ncbi:MAG TPA: U32 family peptidase [Candidatus Ornithospirochaeta avicola]|uniref:U32 family peptidase n=1 Tax=Candidatus Ornithospirochaeta avicola TaxID=2840896 RepID=A0A9D1TMH0_9SPIO|nr:U32 family peptidase [Candidatus Ornithospirochaeta avicola]
MMELALPAGSLENALVAFREGADAVYFGLKSFSARKGAVNFSKSDYLKIRRYAREKKKKIYVTINTLVSDDALEEVYKMLLFLSSCPPDGIIVQDLGIINIIKREFKNLSLHASTQLAVHNIAAVRELESLGFERVVLSRELTENEIVKIRKACPEIEIKVFIHGADCYGFSGLCMASWIITGRSANEGSCAQICRTFFFDESEKRFLYPFSLKDLDFGPDIKRLEKAGIDSLKVEGRLKGNEFVGANARRYRAIIDGKAFNDEYCYTFLRESGNAYFDKAGANHKPCVTDTYTSHRGKEAGVCISQKKNEAVLDRLVDIKNRDGLMVLFKSSKGLDEAWRFSARMKDRNTIILPEAKNILGMMVYKISDSSINERLPSLNIPEEKIEITASVRIIDGFIEIKSSLLEKKIPVKTEKKDKEGNEEQVLRILSQSGSANKYQLKIERIDNENNLFIPPSLLKEARREYLMMLDDAEVKVKHYIIPSIEEEKADALPERALLSSAHSPFNEDGVVINGIRYISLPAIIYDSTSYFERLEKKLSLFSEILMIGLNNISHVEFAKKHKEYSYFADIYLYMSNREAALLLKNELKDSLMGGYLWLERSTYSSPWPFTPTPVKNFLPPLFISRSCYRHDSLKKSCDGCKREHTYKISQSGKKYKVYVKDCQSIVSVDE